MRDAGEDGARPHTPPTALAERVRTACSEFSSALGDSDSGGGCGMREADRCTPLMDNGLAQALLGEAASVPVWLSPVSGGVSAAVNWLNDDIWSCSTWSCAGHAPQVSCYNASDRLLIQRRLLLTAGMLWDRTGRDIRA